MRQEIVELDEFKVTVKEMNLRDIAKTIANIKEIFGDKDLDIQSLVTEKFDTVMDIATGFVTMPKGKSIDELAFSDIDTLTPAFMRVNKSFLDKLDAVGLGLNLQPEPAMETTLKED